MNNSISILAGGLQSWSNEHVGLLVFLLAGSLAAGIYLLRKFYSVAVNFSGLAACSLLVCVSSFLITTTMMSTQGLSMEYFIHVILVAGLAALSLIALSALSVFNSGVGGFTQKSAKLVLYYTVGAAFVVGIAALVEIIANGVKNQSSTDLPVTSVLMVIYVAVLLILAVWQAVMAARIGQATSGIVGSLCLLLAGVCYMLTVTVFLVYALFLTFLLILFAVIAGFKAPEQSAFLIDQFGSKVYGTFYSDRLFYSDSGQRYQRNENEWTPN